MLGIKMGDIKVRTSEKGGDDERVTKFTPTLVRLQASRERAGGRAPRRTVVRASAASHCGPQRTRRRRPAEAWTGRGCGRRTRARCV